MACDIPAPYIWVAVFPDLPWPPALAHSPGAAWSMLDFPRSTPAPLFPVMPVLCPPTVPEPSLSTPLSRAQVSLWPMPWPGRLIYSFPSTDLPENLAEHEPQSHVVVGRSICKCPGVPADVWCCGGGGQSEPRGLTEPQIGLYSFISVFLSLLASLYRVATK